MISIPSPVVFILLDAFRWDYLAPHHTPTLWNLAQTGLYVQKLRPSFGYCEISEYATGARPNTSGKFTQITRATPRSRHLRHYARCLEWLEKMLQHHKGRGSTRLYNSFVRTLIKPGLTDPGIWDLRYRIPLSHLPFLKTIESAHYPALRAFGIESIFDKLHEKGLCIDDRTFVQFNKVAGSDHARIHQLCSEPTHSDLSLIYLGICDGTGHIFGPNTPEICRAAADIDHHVGLLVEAFSRNDARTRFLIVGDHGMLPVSNHIDAAAAISRKAGADNLVELRDYALFLDSTLVRLWFYTDRARTCLSSLFSLPPFSTHGQILDAKTAHDLCVPPPGEAFGHLIWYANPGTVVFPDYFNRDLPKGMHGYPTHIDEQKGMAILSGPNILPQTRAEAELIDLCPTLCDLFQIGYPDHNQGISLFATPSP